jgi:hypothetical protein
MVVVWAWANGGKADHSIYPVLAIECRGEQRFSRTHRPGDHRRPPTAGLSDAEGWGHESTGCEYDVLVMDDEYGICAASLAFESSNGAYRVVVAGWPPEEDEHRLAVVIAELEAQVIAKEKAKGICPTGQGA